VFEIDSARRYKLHRRRADFLKAIVDAKLSPHHYLPLIQEIIYELATSHEAMMDCKEEEFKAASAIQDRLRLARDANNLGLHAIQLYKEFVESYNDEATKKSPEPFKDPEDAKAVMTARIRMAWLWTKLHVIPTTETSAYQDMRDQKIQYLKRSLEEYLVVNKYCMSYEIPEFDATFEVVQEMCELLPRQIEQEMSRT
jgi:hypothetical protein